MFFYSIFFTFDFSDNFLYYYYYLHPLLYIIYDKGDLYMKSKCSSKKSRNDVLRIIKK